MKPIFTFPALVFSLLMSSCPIAQSLPQDIKILCQEVQSMPQVAPGPDQEIQKLPQEFDRMPYDTIQPIPFTETWDSASFTANGWRFPWMQGNWTILDSTGNPGPCAAFTGTPSQSTYIYALVSPWFDATDLTCDRIYLDFDISLSTLQTTGTEKLTVILESDTTEVTLLILANDASFSWKHKNFHLYGMLGKYFRIKLIASGVYAGRISQWELDNIAITRECLTPNELDCSTDGLCNWPAMNCFVYLSWNPPECPLTAEEYWFIYDDDNWEDGLRINPGDVTWIGNLFPVDPGICGTMERVDIYFVDNGSGSPQNFTVELFDAYGTSLGSSAIFSGNAPNYWISVPLPGIPFSGPVYVMVKYDNLPGNGYYLACDTDGPFTSQMLAYIYDGYTWTNPSFWPGGGVFFVRGLAMVETDHGEKKRVVLTPGGIVDEQMQETPGLDQLGVHVSTTATRNPRQRVKSGPDSSLVIGYNVYRKQELWPYDTAFYKINQDPVPGTSYLDTIGCYAFYYITTVYSNGCESEPFEISCGGGCFIGIPEESAGNHLQISPNPADVWIEVNSKAGIEAVLLYDMTGRELYRKQTPGEFNLRIDLPGLPEGLYIVKVVTEKGPTASRIMILH